MIVGRMNNAENSPRREKKEGRTINEKSMGI